MLRKDVGKQILCLGESTLAHLSVFEGQLKICIKIFTSTIFLVRIYQRVNWKKFQNHIYETVPFNNVFDSRKRHGIC